MRRSEQISELFWKRFVQRDDCYPVQLSGGRGYTVIRERLTRKVVTEHLQGKKTIGLYVSANGTTRWLCVDIDDLDEIAVREVQNHARRFKIPYLTEFSGKKGYHIWVFFDRPYPNRIARALAGAFAFDHEVFPKQNRIEKGKLGNLVKAPLGKHGATGEWCLFLDKDLRPEKDQYGVLTEIQVVNPIQILKQYMPEVWAKAGARSPVNPKAGKEVVPMKIPILKDCVKAAIIEGAKEGRRNQVGHIIASELRGLGFSKDQADIGLSSLWNRRNKPPLSEEEVSIIINSAYGDTEYDYQCKEDSPLMQYLRCKREDNCFYLNIHKTIYRGH